MKTDDINLTRPEFWMGDPYPTLRWLRQHRPVFHHDVDGTHPFWAVTKYDDIAEVSKRPDNFLSGNGVAMTPPPDMPQTENMVEMDDPRHKLMRALVSKGFTPPSIRQHESRIRELAAAIVDELEGDECDFVTAVSSALPIFVIGEETGPIAKGTT